MWGAGGELGGGGTIFDLIKAMALVAVRSENCDSMAKLLQPDGSVNNQPLCTANPEIGMDEPDAEASFLSGRHCKLW